MSSVITGERIESGNMQVPVTWAAMAAGVQLLGVLGAVFLFAGDLRARTATLEHTWDQHKIESVHRVEFERERQVNDARLSRIEAKIDTILERLPRGQ